MSSKIKITDEMMGEARSWYVRLANEQADASDWELFTVWLEENPLHVEAYDRVELMLADISAAPSGAEQESNGAEQESNVVQLSPKQRPARPRMWFTGIAALLVMALTLFVTSNIIQTNPVVTQYATNIGGHEDIVLKDGTKISLNTNTQISVAMGKKTRTVTIQRGEAYFDIASDEKRQFVVLAQDTIITDIGTAFSVYTADKKLTVSVAQGIVDMNNGLHTIRLTRGQKAVQQRGETDVSVTAIDVNNVSTWRDGVLVFEDAALSNIVPELNRYFQRPILLSGDEVSNLVFSGVLNISNQDTLLSSMEALMPLKAKTQNGQIILSSEN